MTKSCHKNFWNEVRKVTKSSKGCPLTNSNIDGYYNDEDISNAFAAKLKCLLNADNCLNSRSDLLHSIEETLSHSDLESSVVSPEDVAEALSRIKPGKSDGTELISNHFLYAKSILNDFLSKLFTAMLRHGYIPQCLRDCVLQPIPKPGKDPTDSDNYRAIALAPTLSKVFEWCVLLTNKSAFATSPLQFGFKEGLSTDLCTGLIKNVVAKYITNETAVYGCFLDASKAFDRVNHTLLFEKLCNKNLSPAVTRTLLSWYSQQVCVRWNASHSEKFPVGNGVRQGGVLSPILFTVYIDDLLYQL